AKIAQAPDATKGGNSTKRIRLKLEVPRFQPSEATHLARVLAAKTTAAVPTFILAWNPMHFRWQDHDYDQAIQVTGAGQPWHDEWTVGGRTGGITPGDRAFLYRQHEDRGLVASGTFTSEVYTAPHWDGSGRQARYARLDWDIVLDHEDRLPVEELKVRVGEVQ